MSMFDDVTERVKASLSDWIQVIDPESQWTIESFEKTGYDEEMIKPHCVNCVIVNRCWFKNEVNKKPEEFDYAQHLDIPMEKRGLYHPNCHDQKIPIKTPDPKDVEIFELEERMEYLFTKKKELLYSFGYNDSDKNEVFYLLRKLSKEVYCKGNYINNPPKEEWKNKYGFRIRINLDFPGKRGKLGRVYKITSSYIVYPNGKLKNNTPIGGWAK